jgi:hypothetical protein
MKPIVLIGLSVVACLVGPFVLSGGGEVLDESEAMETFGGACWGPDPKFICDDVGTCDSWNQVKNCPNLTGYCSFCSEGTILIWNCVVDASGGECWNNPTGTDCGLLREGMCYDSECTWLATYRDCNDGFSCGPGCP